MKKQILLIHGGNVFDKYEDYINYLQNYKLTLERLTKKDWKDTLQDKLSDFEVIFPTMPNKQNAKYSEWKIWFEKIIPFLENDVVLIGHSLGGIFLAKYLSENDFPVKISSTHLVAAPFEPNDLHEPLGDFALEKGLKMFAEQGGEIYLYFSKDDPSVPFNHLSKFKELLPNANEVIFEDRGHFKQKEFLELIENIKS
jgi:predicted alpha/beta hydrolase family esterase